MFDCCTEKYETKFNKMLVIHMTNICYLLIYSSGGSLHFFIDDSLFKLVVLEKR